MAETTTRTPWRLKVHWVETCNCEAGCNCNFGGFPDYGFCQAICGIAVEEGHYGSIDLAGVNAVFAGKWPKAIHDGHGQVVVFVDSAATLEQAEAMTAILSSRDGGVPWEIFATTIERLEGPVRRPITMTIDGRRSRFQVDGVLQVALTPLKNPVTGDEHEVHIVFPKGGSSGMTAIPRRPRRCGLIMASSGMPTRRRTPSMPGRSGPTSSNGGTGGASDTLPVRGESQGGGRAYPPRGRPRAFRFHDDGAGAGAAEPDHG